jgi:hypothetical protein
MYQVTTLTNKKNVITMYNELEILVNDFRDLSERERKMFIQRIIDQVLYDPKKFQVAVKILSNWESK